MAKASGSIDLKSLKVAGEGASKYITSIDSNTGIQIQAQNNTRNIRINSQTIDIREGTNVLATFGSTTRIGQNSAENVTINSDGMTLNTPDLQSAVKLTSDMVDDVYEGVIYLGGDHGNQPTPYISGYTNADPEFKWNEVRISASTNDEEYTAGSYLQADYQGSGEVYAQATVTAQVYGGSATANMGVDDGNDSASVHVIPGTIDLSAETISFTGQPWLLGETTAYYDAEKENGDFKARFGCGSNNGRHGIYSSSSASGIDSKWIIMRDQTGDIFVGGTTATYKLAAWVNAYGATNDWTWRKYSDGTFDAWGTFTVTPTSSTASGSIYYSNAISVNLPFTASSGSVIVTGSVGSQYAWLVNTSAATTTVSFRIARGAAISTSTALSVRLHVFGEY